MNLLHGDITKLEVDAKDSTEAIDLLGRSLMENGYIKQGYVDSVLKREQTFPTGLVLKNVGIAIPHASPEGNVLKNGIAIARLNNPVQFNWMENPDEKIDVNMVFMLALADSSEHLDVLKKLFVAFQNEELVESLKNSGSDKFLGLLNEKLA